MVIVEELGDLEDPSHGVVAVEMRDVKFDVVAGRRGKRVVGVRAGVKVEGVGVRVTGATTTLVWSRGVRKLYGLDVDFVAISFGFSNGVVDERFVEGCGDYSGLHTLFGK